jgi:hypothetical protein
MEDDNGKVELKQTPKVAMTSIKITQEKDDNKKSLKGKDHISTKISKVNKVNTINNLMVNNLNTLKAKFKNVNANIRIIEDIEDKGNNNNNNNNKLSSKFKEILDIIGTDINQNKLTMSTHIQNYFSTKTNQNKNTQSKLNTLYNDIQMLNNTKISSMKSPIVTEKTNIKYLSTIPKKTKNTPIVNLNLNTNKNSDKDKDGYKQYSNLTSVLNTENTNRNENKKKTVVKNNSNIINLLYCNNKKQNYFRCDFKKKSGGGMKENFFQNKMKEIKSLILIANTQKEKSFFESEQKIKKENEAQIENNHKLAFNNQYYLTELNKFSSKLFNRNDNNNISLNFVNKNLKKNNYHFKENERKVKHK